MSLTIAWAHCNTIDLGLPVDQIINMENFLKCDVGVIHELTTKAYSFLAPEFDRNGFSTHYTPYGLVEDENVGMLVVWNKQALSLEELSIHRPTSSKNSVQIITFELTEIAQQKFTMLSFRIPARQNAIECIKTITTLAKDVDVYAISGIPKEEHPLALDILYHFNTTDVFSFVSRISDADCRVVMTVNSKYIPVDISSFDNTIVAKTYLNTP